MLGREGGGGFFSPSLLGAKVRPSPSAVLSRLADGGCLHLCVGGLPLPPPLKAPCSLAGPWSSTVGMPQVLPPGQTAFTRPRCFYKPPVTHRTERFRISPGQNKSGQTPSAGRLPRPPSPSPEWVSLPQPFCFLLLSLSSRSGPLSFCEGSKSSAAPCPFDTHQGGHSASAEHLLQSPRLSAAGKRKAERGRSGARRQKPSLRLQKASAAEVAGQQAARGCGCNWPAL